MASVMLKLLPVLLLVTLIQGRSTPDRSQDEVLDSIFGKDRHQTARVTSTMNPAGLNEVITKIFGEKNKIKRAIPSIVTASTPTPTEAISESDTQTTSCKLGKGNTGHGVCVPYYMCEYDPPATAEYGHIDLHYGGDFVDQCINAIYICCEASKVLQVESSSSSS